jgi:NADH:ubiquinone oxidoreductase subunit
MFALRATFHTTLKATPSQLVFGRYAILNDKFFEADWNFIKDNKQRLIYKNNSIENNKIIPYTYQIHEHVLREEKPTSLKYGPAVWEGPFEIVKINDNKSVCIRKGIHSETVNLRRIRPYHNPT